MSAIQHASHVVDYYCWMALRNILNPKPLSPPYVPFGLPAEPDFDLLEEQRDGWAYQQHEEYLQ